jgi:hypothetical protein
LLLVVEEVVVLLVRALGVVAVLVELEQVFPVLCQPQLILK